VTNETIQRKWENTLAEYAKVRAEHISSSMLSMRAQTADPFEAQCPELKAELRSFIDCLLDRDEGATARPTRDVVR
jgi:hypothetical protein